MILIAPNVVTRTMSKTVPTMMLIKPAQGVFILIAKKLKKMLTVSPPSMPTLQKA